MNPLALIAGLSWPRAAAAMKRWALPGLLAILVATSVWYFSQSKRLAGEAEANRDRAATAEKRALDAERLRAEAEVQSEAALVRATMLTAAVERQKGELDALKEKYGATAVSDLTREHLRRLRDAQRASR